MLQGLFLGIKPFQSVFKGQNVHAVRDIKHCAEIPFPDDFPAGCFPRAVPAAVHVPYPVHGAGVAGFPFGKRDPLFRTTPAYAGKLQIPKFRCAMHWKGDMPIFAV